MVDSDRPLCRYCKRPFPRKRKKQKFCKQEHKDAFHAERRRAALEAYSTEGHASDRNPAAVALGRLGGLASGRARRAKAEARKEDTA